MGSCRNLKRQDICVKNSIQCYDMILLGPTVVYSALVNVEDVFIDVILKKKKNVYK